MPAALQRPHEKLLRGRCAVLPRRGEPSNLQLQDGLQLSTSSFRAQRSAPARHNAIISTATPLNTSAIFRCRVPRVVRGRWLKRASKITEYNEPTPGHRHSPSTAPRAARPSTRRLHWSGLPKRPHPRSARQPAPRQSRACAVPAPRSPARPVRLRPARARHRPRGCAAATRRPCVGPRVVRPGPRSQVGRAAARLPGRE